MTWSGRIKPLIGRHGTLTAHIRPDLAVRAAKRQRDALQDLWGAAQPWFYYQVIDRRSGEVLESLF